MNRINISNIAKTAFASVLTASVLLSATAYADEAIVSQKPLMLSIGVPPNILLTLDESGSMSWGFIPDTSMSAYKNLIGGNSWKRYHAHNTNPMAYNPHVVYEIPPAFDSNGEPLKLSTDFYDAPANGFGASHNTYNPKRSLATQYRPIYAHRIPFDAPNYAYHPNDSNGGWTNNNNGRQKYTAAYYYEFDGDLVHTPSTWNRAEVLCKDRIGDSDAGGEQCYRYRKVDKNSAYDENRKPLYDADGNPVDGRQNFAIWYSFYRSRALATLSAASIAFHDLDPQVRFIWQNLKTCSFQGLSKNERNNLGICNNNGLRPYSKKHRGEFYTWLRKLYFNVGTPLPASMKRAGEFLKKDVAWQLNPGGSGNTKNNTYACRPSYHVLMTDGMWNETASSPSDFRSDDEKFKTPGGFKNEAGEYEQFPPMQYDKNKPYYDSKSTTLADFAMHYWATDLRSDLDNRVPPHVPYKNTDKTKEYWDPRNNPAEWQHMTNFIMGLGLTTSLDNSKIPWAGSTHEGQGYQNLLSGAASWPPASRSSANNVYDLWHAAINSRGEFYSVDTPDAMVAAFNDIIGRIAVRQSTASLPAVASVIEDDAENEGRQKLVSYFYESSYDSDNWTGDLVKNKKHISYHNNIRREEVSEEWRASRKLPSHDKRQIKMVKNGQLVDFKTTNATTVLKNALKLNPETNKFDNRWQDRLNYIRGDQTHESGSNAFRQRESLLGDFLSSEPALVSGARYIPRIANSIEENTKYSEFASAKKNRRAQIYVGGNAGMLHAFDAKTGEEKFAFVPTGVFDKLHHLVNPEYNHFYYVEGTPVIADVFDGNNWRTILVGTLAAGGKGMFALDITNPDEIKLLWEIGPQTPGYDDMGYTVPKPTVARLHSGEWAVVTGNGYGGDGHEQGKASLYAINALDGSLIHRFAVTGKVKQDGVIVPNGLSAPKLADFDADGVADYAYAGDLQGNLWRFDLLGHTASPTKTQGSIYGGKKEGTTKFKVSYAGKPMFTAESATGGLQPITAPPSIVRHPHHTGHLVIVGTGKYVGSGDKAGITDYAQSVYGIWDKNTKAETELGSLTISRNSLQKQELLEELVAVSEAQSFSREARTITNNAVNWNQQHGWRLDLSVGEGYAGEMVVNDMVTIGGVVFVPSLVPNDDPCASGAGNWVYALNPATGGRIERHVFDVGNPDPDHKIQVITGLKSDSPGGIGLVPIASPSSGNGGGTGGQSGQDGAIVGPRGGPVYVYIVGIGRIMLPSAGGRETWRVVPNP